MGLTIMWKPVSNEGHPISGHSEGLEQTHEIFGSVLDRTETYSTQQVLLALALVAPHGPWRDLEAALRDHEKIEVYGD